MIVVIPHRSHIAILRRTLLPQFVEIHNIANGARVVGPTLGGFTQDWIGSTPDSYNWLQQFISLGGLGYLDVVDIHNYTFTRSTFPTDRAPISA